jgi:hypothetical protein
MAIFATQYQVTGKEAKKLEWSSKWKDFVAPPSIDLKSHKP